MVVAQSFVITFMFLDTRLLTGKADQWRRFTSVFRKSIRIETSTADLVSPNTDMSSITVIYSPGQPSESFSCATRRDARADGSSGSDMVKSSSYAEPSFMWLTYPDLDFPYQCLSYYS